MSNFNLFKTVFGNVAVMAKAMDKSEGSDDLDIDEIKDFLTKRRKSPVGKSVKIMAAIKTPAKKAKYK